MCGCSPVCKSFFDTYRARRIVRTCVGPLHAAHHGRGPLWCAWLRVQISPKDSFWSAVGTWFSRSRPCDRLTHERSRNSPPFASDEDALGEFRSRSRRPAWTTSFPWFSFLLLSATPARAAPVDSSPSIGRTSSPLAPSGLPRIPLETSHDVWGHPRREGSNHSISP